MSTIGIETKLTIAQRIMNHMPMRLFAVEGRGLSLNTFLAVEYNHMGLVDEPNITYLFTRGDMQLSQQPMPSRWNYFS